MIQTRHTARRIHEAAREVGVTPRAIRYYEQLGLLPASQRSRGDQRLFSDDDVARLHTIKALRDDAGFSLADIGELLHDEAERDARRAAYHGTTDVQRRRVLLGDELQRIERHVVLLRGKIDRLAGMVGDAEARRARCLEQLAILDASDKDSSQRHDS